MQKYQGDESTRQISPRPHRIYFPNSLTMLQIFQYVAWGGGGRQPAPALPSRRRPACRHPAPLVWPLSLPQCIDNFKQQLDRLQHKLLCIFYSGLEQPSVVSIDKPGVERVYRHDTGDIRARQPSAASCRRQRSRRLQTCPFPLLP